jgi:hypothetical protein
MCRSDSDSEGASEPQATGKVGRNTNSDSTNYPSFAAFRAQATSAAPDVETKDLVLLETGEVATAEAVRA